MFKLSAHKMQLKNVVPAKIPWYTFW